MGKTNNLKNISAQKLIKNNILVAFLSIVSSAYTHSFTQIDDTIEKRWFQKLNNVFLQFLKK